MEEKKLFSLGIEEEFQIVDPESRELSKNDMSLRLAYLINQLIHYLSIIKNK